VKSWLSTGFLLLALLLTISLGRPPAPEAAQLAAVGAAALLSRALLSSGGWRKALGSLAAPLDLAADLVLALFAMSLTGGIASDLAPLLLLQILLASRFLGPQAGRFVAAATLFGLALLASLTGGLVAGIAANPLPFLLRILWPLAVLAATELHAPAAAAASQAQPPAREETAAKPAPERVPPPPAPQPPPRRDAGKEVLHDLKSPLSVIRVYAELIGERARRGEPPQEDHVSNLRSEIELMESLLGVPPTPRKDARAPASRGERFDLVKILSALAHSYRLAHSNKLQIDFLAEQPEIPILADLVSLQRAFRNVLENAVKYTPAGGRIRIRVGSAGQQAFVAISDTGTGISEDEIDRAFEFFFRGREARASGAEGKGLGLGLSRELVEANGGRISITSEPGRGSDVTILLPIGKEGTL
jgi:signal transduction histidine kinase